MIVRDLIFCRCAFRSMGWLINIINSDLCEVILMIFDDMIHQQLNRIFFLEFKK